MISIVRQAGGGTRGSFSDGNTAAIHWPAVVVEDPCFPLRCENGWIA